MKINLRSLLVDLDECGDSVLYPKTVTVRKAWRQCKRADHMLWLAAKLGVDRKVVAMAACECALTALKYTKGTDTFDPTCECIETTVRWLRGEPGVSLEDVVRARRAAYAAAAYVAAAYAAAYAAAAYAAAAYAAAASAAAASSVAYAAAAAYAAARRKPEAKALAKMAIIVRRHISGAMIEEKIRERSGK